MKYFLILIIVLLSGMLVRANDPDIVSPNYDITVTDKNKTVDLIIPSSLGQISYASIGEGKEDTLIDCLVSLGEVDDLNVKTSVYNIKRIGADISIYTLSKNNDKFKVMVVYTKPEIRLENNLTHNDHRCDFLNSVSPTTKWFGNLNIGQTTIIMTPDGNELYLQINKSK
jgi:hypothetical protein